LGPEGQESSGPKPVEVDASNTPRRRVWSIQRLVYNISEVLHDGKTRCLEMHKLLYAVLIASRKLHHYFQAHKILVVTSYPLKVMLRSPNATGNIAKWVVELAEFELDFIPCHAVKSQVLTDFVTDWTPPPRPLGGPDISELKVKAPIFTKLYWTLFFDISSCKHGARAGVLLCSRLLVGSSSSIWCTMTPRQPTTWHSTRPSSSG
jgi:hypothetical protein